MPVTNEALDEDIIIEEDDEYIYVEQAEYLDSQRLLDWNEEHPDESIILEKLINPGAKVITGPRGCGKTTLMKKAYLNVLQQKKHIFPIYVNYKSSLSIEPFYKKDSKAIFIFKQWLLLKIYLGIAETLEYFPQQALLNDFFKKIALYKAQIEQLEIGNISGLESFESITIETLNYDLTQIFNQYNFTRSILLLDDAAHAFSIEEQRDFFDLFRQLKSNILAPKAAIYPGITNYSPSFHVGHDAEEIDVWIKPDNKNYLIFCNDLLKKRFPEDIYKQLQAEEGAIELISYAAFGIPRALINIVRYTIHNDEKISLKNLRDAIKRHIAETTEIFLSLKSKLPLYEGFITAGHYFYTNIVRIIKEYNTNKDLNKKTFTLALNETIGIPNEIKKVLNFFQYSGLILPKGKISRGEKGIYSLYEIHYSELISKNAITISKAFNIRNILEAFKNKDTRIIVRPTLKTLLGTLSVEESFKLSLPPCKKCGAMRIGENQKFCIQCGSELKLSSIFESMINQDISKLPRITKKRVSLIKKNSKIKTIKDILMDNDYKELRKVPQIGKFRAQQTYLYAQEYIS